ncbi:dimethyl sulfoxide reductase anchor subunit family protein [Dongia rigui]|uniref:DmsC/YnfH family molybdoenzyme membrane anchor subunit n=1 Tax=Dongia rigui TaxID=940149 RepID=A0ABU5E602_9PROT|nr:DmsC/YnfH family molybdoenzyme membrane anchor subunit [Dongia rigui]MDY0874306.1 DmsC/YnfH family molybdoenzyme membrane anchor subunit [Dongia rigui]
MYPAYSVIFFTSASGAGYALLALLNLLALFGLLPAERWLGLTGFLVGLIAVTAGLLSSTYHLGRPERAWRAFSQWRSSWLSREGVLAVVTFAPAGITALGWVFWEQIWWFPAIILIACTVATICATAMIYASLKTIRRWNNGWTLPGYLGMGLASGSLWLCLLCALFGLETRLPSLLAIAMVAIAAGIKLGYWRFVDGDIGASTAGSATGLGRFGKVRLFAAPHTEENYLLKEMGFKVARKHAQKLRRIASRGAFAVPLIAVLLALAVPTAGPWLMVVAVLANAIGTVTERWLFFAEARHVVTLYYGADAA